MEPKKNAIQPLVANQFEKCGQAPQTCTFEAKGDTEIWQLFKKGDKAAFTFIYQKFFKVLYNYGHQFTQDEELIKDCIHDVFAEISHTKQRLSDTDNIKFYLLRSFRNRFLYYQKKVRKKQVDEHLTDGYNFEFSFSIEQKMIDSQINQEKLHKLNKAIRQLPVRQKEVIYYLFYEELSIEAIQQVMQVTHRRTIQNIVYRALANLRKIVIMLIFHSLLLYFPN